MAAAGVAWSGVFEGLLGGLTATPTGCLPAWDAPGCGLERAFLIPLCLFSFADTIPEDFQEFQTQNFDRSNTTCQGTWEQYHPPAYWVTGIQIFVPAANPAVLSEPAPALLSHNPGAPGEHCLRQSLMDERHFVGGTQQRCSSLPLEQNNISLDALETLDAYEEQCNFIHITFPTRQHSSVPKEIDQVKWIIKGTFKHS